MMADIVVIGSFVMDMTARVPHFVNDGETLLADDFYLACGGKGVNQAVAAARLGGSVEMAGMVGDDSYGRRFADMLTEEGVDHGNVFVSDCTPTGMAHIQINRECQNRIIVILGANAGMDMSVIESIDASIRKAKIVMVQFELDLELTREILRRAKRYGATTILNPAPARMVDISLLKNADYITPNDVELGALSGMPTDTVEECLAAARYLHDNGVKNVIATLGGNGALIVSDDIERIIPIFPVTVADTVGAGDSFNGALAVKLIEGADIVDAVLFANAEGALTVSCQGAIPALHYRHQVDEFLEKNMRA